MTAREIRKELLIAESNVLRSQLGQDLAIIHQGLEGLGERAKTLSSYAAIVTTVLTGISEFRARKAEPNGKASFFTTLLAGARTASAIWESVRSRPR